jgi:[acyl-carrier-protein] S-malonyltransferase
MSLAILCSGQGRQHSDMFSLTANIPQAASLFAHATTLLGGRDPREIVLMEAPDVLRHNRIGQILCTLQALTAALALRDELTGRLNIAGYSVGEVAAWGVAGLFSMTDTLDLVARRAEAMDAVTPPNDGLLFVRGLPRDVIDGLCDRYDVAIAIINPDLAFILGGSRKALDSLAEAAKAMNASRVVDVSVEVASHTKRLASASVQFRDSLSKVSLQSRPASDVRLLSGIDAAPVLDINRGLDKLAAQISQTVHWADCLQGSVEGGASVFLELGPGQALSQMAREAHPDLPARSLDDFKTLQGVKDWIAKHAPAAAGG